jgi:hypothetical protein
MGFNFKSQIGIAGMGFKSHQHIKVKLGMMEVVLGTP